MMSMESHMDRLMSHHHDESRRLLYLRTVPMQQVPASAISTFREDSLPARRPPPAGHHHPLQLAAGRPDAASSVSRRNARERKRVRLVNQGFVSLRERVPPGTRNKKLSKVETLRAAIEYIRQLQDVLGLESPGGSQAGDENFEGLAGGSGTELSPASSLPSEGGSSFVQSPYELQQAQEDCSQLLDIGGWFS